MSLNRLINLARKTGDRLIVHQPDEGHDVVIMNVDEYEALVVDEYTDVRTLPAKQLIDKINRDIAIWRANDKFDGNYLDEEEEKEAGEEDLGGDWSSAGSVLDNKFVYPEEDFSARELGREDSDAETDSEDNFEKQVDDQELNLAADKIEALKEVPWIENADKINEWREEALSEDEPVFYEEPV